MLEKLDKFHKTRRGHAVFGVVELVPAAQAPQVRSSLALGALVTCVPGRQSVQSLQLV